MKFGADVNALTTFDETVYQVAIPSDDPALVDHGLDILHEWAQGIAFDPVEVDKERGVILEERRLRHGAEGRLLETIIPAAFSGSPYVRRLPIGNETIIKTVQPDVLQRYYREWYRPDLMAVIVVGDLDTGWSRIGSSSASRISPLRPRRIAARRTRCRRMTSRSRWHSRTPSCRSPSWP